jgi:hypothetical protein
MKNFSISLPFSTKMPFCLKLTSSRKILLSNSLEKASFFNFSCSVNVPPQSNPAHKDPPSSPSSTSLHYQRPPDFFKSYFNTSNFCANTTQQNPDNYMNPTKFLLALQNPPIAATFSNLKCLLPLLPTPQPNINRK